MAPGTRIILNSFLLLQVSCGSSTVPAAATRVVDVELSVLTNKPVCFRLPRPDWGLTERAEASRILSICEGAAIRQNVRVVPFASGNCLVATMRFTSADTGNREAECTTDFAYGANCGSRAIHQKTVKVSLSQIQQSRAIAETTAAIESSFSGFSKESIFALCSAAFRDFPKPLQSEQFETPFE